MLLQSAVAASLLAATGAKNFNYSTVTGYFLQDETSTNASTFDYTATNFGLINRTYDAECGGAHQTQWQKFAREVTRLNHEASKSTVYKLLFMGRHGEGYHNSAESTYGTPAWNCYWSLLNGNETSTWADAALTVNGIAQAQKANNFWQQEIAVQKIPIPQSYYVSPLQRCLQTANVTFHGLDLPARHPFIPTIKEKLREGISLHTCDRRHNKTHIHHQFPKYVFEKGFAELDPFWNGVTAETSDAQDVRSRSVLDDIFSHDESTYISITSHSGEIGSILRVLGHRTFSLSTGAVIPVLVKAEVLKETPTSSSTSWSMSPHCTVPPVTSVSGGPSGGCICPSSAAPVTTPLISIGQFKKRNTNKQFTEL